jgi:hypothetical protein
MRCLAKADQDTGRLTDGRHQQFRCYEASIESRYRSVREHRWRNFELLRRLDASSMSRLLLIGISAARRDMTTHVRWFTGGDFFSPDMRDAVIGCAVNTPGLSHYAYTKSLPFFRAGTRWLELPSNLRITFSWGGHFDHLMEELPYPRTARVLHHRADAEAAGLPVDTTDRFAWQDEPTHFCHLSHGGQPAGSPGSTAIAARRKAGDFTGYGSRKLVFTNN